MEPSLGYREVIPDQTMTEKWTEFSINTGNLNSVAGGLPDYNQCTERSGNSWTDRIVR